ncbi:hypothetical protein MP478_08110 [Chryseobacterium sp. WG14]|uniref:hypothetical protein n=1 Tax=Chryseobacterium sp. WG14 TaxID=2926909 RepID=UPI00211EAE72|nr:hypothetical protein [Chryseobacterium sp. WG14]MCQ9639356.1 hypothetical protein [Chryseobacterium sp. WG14]
MDIQEKTIMFFKKCGVYDDKLKNKTIINDVNEDFMDLESLFESFFKDFDIENSCDFDVYKYFHKVSFFSKILIAFGFKIKTEINHQ